MQSHHFWHVSKSKIAEAEKRWPFICKFRILVPNSARNFSQTSARTRTDLQPCNKLVKNDQGRWQKNFQGDGKRKLASVMYYICTLYENPGRATAPCPRCRRPWKQREFISFFL